MLNDVNRRDRDFLRAVRREAAGSRVQGRPMTVCQAVRRAVSSPAPSYYVTTDYAWRVLRGGGAPRRRGRPARAAMWEDLRRRFEEELSLRPAADAYAVLDELLSRGGAPRFFISESRGVSLYFKLLTKRRNGTESQQ